MVCCLLCFDDAPIEGDPRAGYTKKWEIGMMDAPCKNPLGFCYSFICCPCAQWQLREKALEGDWQRYRCCQGYYDCMCWKAGSVGDTGNQCCACIELCCPWCLSCAVSSTRALVMDTRNIMPDPCDNRIIRFNNCMQLIACICHILAIIDQTFEDLANLIDFIADMVFLTTQACMTVQTDWELKNGQHQVQWGVIAPRAGQWNKEGGGQPQSAPPQGQSMGRQDPYGGQPQYGNQPMAVAQPANQFAVTCPPGCGPGMPVQVQTPTGQMMQVNVPPGVMPGQQFMVQY